MRASAAVVSCGAILCVLRQCAITKTTVKKTTTRRLTTIFSGWEPINTNIPESIGVGSQYWGLSIGDGGVLNKIIF